MPELPITFADAASERLVTEHKDSHQSLMITTGLLLGQRRHWVQVNGEPSRELLGAGQRPKADASTWNSCSGT